MKEMASSWRGRGVRGSGYRTSSVLGSKSHRGTMKHLYASSHCYLSEDPVTQALQLTRYPDL